MGNQYSHSASFSRRATAPRMKQMEYMATHLSRAGWCRYREVLLKKMKMTKAMKVSSTFSRPGMVCTQQVISPSL